MLRRRGIVIYCDTNKVPAYRERRIMSYRKWDFGVIKVRDTHLICNDTLR
jgi:hypothetical protein